MSRGPVQIGSYSMRETSFLPCLRACMAIGPVQIG